MTVGSIEVIVGCMFSGKSEELLRRLRRHQIARKAVTVFKPLLDTRWGKVSELCSRNGICFQARPVSDPSEIEQMYGCADVVGIDEVHFFAPALIDVVERIRKSGITIIVSGLDMDFRGQPFGCVPQLLAIADSIVKLDAVCMVCGGRATMSQRLINKCSVSQSEEQILVGDDEYEARCRDCIEYAF